MLCYLGSFVVKVIDGRTTYCVLECEYPHKNRQPGCACPGGNPVYHKRSKHIGIDFVRYYVECGTLAVQYVPTLLNTADIFTKPFPLPRFRDLFKLLHLDDA
jgi:hypothetical protein